MPNHLKRRGQIWHLQKTLRFRGRSVNIRRSTGETDRGLAEEVAQAIIESERHKLLYGAEVRKTVTEAVAYYLALPGNDTADNRYHLDMLEPYVGALALEEVYQDHPFVQAFIRDRRAAGRTNNTINRSLERLRCVLNRATEWRERPLLAAGGAQISSPAASGQKLSHCVRSPGVPALTLASRSPVGRAAVQHPRPASCRHGGVCAGQGGGKAFQGP